jgi:3-oxoacyl-[acyl-carrier protein] reductase
LKLHGKMNGKSIVIVGGSHGIGAEIARRCVDRGAAVTVIARSRGNAPESADFLEGDATQDSFGGLSLPETVDGLVYAPGSIHLGPLRSMSLSTIREDMELNVIGAIRTMQLALAGLKKARQASCVLFSTIAVAQGLPMHTSIAAAKGAVEALTRTWAAELSPTVRVNCVAPALTNTRLAEKFLSTDEKRATMATKYPLGRVGEATDIAAAATYLLSEESSWVTGQVLRVDGGMSTLKK